MRKHFLSEANAEKCSVGGFVSTSYEGLKNLSDAALSSSGAERESMLRSVLIACAPAALPERDLRFTKPFPYDSTGRDLSIWATSLETASPMMLEVDEK
jgi:hypothetical protein